MTWQSQQLFNDTDENTWQRAFAEGLLPVATGLVLTVGIGTLLSQNRRNQERRLELATFVEDQVVKLWDARSHIKRAAVLISARRDVHTYDEQIADLVDTRSSLMNVRGAVRRAGDDTQFAFEYPATFNALLEDAVHALSRLIYEYHQELSKLDSGWEAIEKLHCLGQLVSYGQKTANEIEADSKSTSDDIVSFVSKAVHEKYSRENPTPEFDLNEHLLLPLAYAATLLERTFETRPRTG